MCNPALSKLLWSALGLGLFLTAWAVLALVYPPYILPGPAEGLARLPDFWREGHLVHLRATFGEAGGGFLLALLAAVPLGTLIYRRPWLERLVSPYVVGSQAVPIVALAPLLVLWFGTGLLPKILVAALVAFFPILVNVVAGFKQVDPRLHELVAIMGADPWQRWRKLELPAALPFIFAGLRVGLTLTVIGALVGEFAGADRVLGYLVNYAKGLFDIPLMFLALLALAAMSVGFYLLLILVERLAMPWRRERS